MVYFLAGATASEVYSPAIEHKVGRELTSIARKCMGQTSIQSALSNLNCKCSPMKTNHTVLYGILTCDKTNVKKGIRKQPGVHFTNIIKNSFYVQRSQKPQKDSQVKQLFALLGSAGAKAARKHFDEIDPRWTE